MTIYRVIVNVGADDYARDISDSVWESELEAIRRKESLSGDYYYIIDDDDLDAYMDEMWQINKVEIEKHIVSDAKREMKVLGIVTYNDDVDILAVSESEDALMKFLRENFAFFPIDENEDIEKAIAEYHGWWKGWWKNQKLVFDYWKIETVAEV